MVVIVENENAQDTFNAKYSSAVLRNVLCCVAMATVILVSVFVLEKLSSSTNNNTDTSHIEYAIVSRSGWGADPLVVDYAYESYNQINTISIFQTNTRNCSTFIECSEVVRKIQRSDMEILGEVDITYNFLIGGDGNVYEGTGWQGMHTEVDIRFPELRVAFIGDYRYFALSSKQKLAFKAFINNNLESHISELFSVEISCCKQSHPAFVGYHVFQYFYSAYFPVSCLPYYFEQSWRDDLCDMRNRTLSGFMSNNRSALM